MSRSNQGDVSKAARELDALRRREIRRQLLDRGIDPDSDNPEELARARQSLNDSASK